MIINTMIAVRPATPITPPTVPPAIAGMLLDFGFEPLCWVGWLAAADLEDTGSGLEALFFIRLVLVAESVAEAWLLLRAGPNGAASKLFGTLTVPEDATELH